ncbi:hypothetical protein LguiA_027612 [Lonicera macranthoides]
MGNGEMIMQEIKKTSIGKATVLALGKAFPHQLVMQEYLHQFASSLPIYRQNDNNQNKVRGHVRQDPQQVP